MSHPTDGYLAPAARQDDTLDPEDVERTWSITTALPAALLEVLGPQVKVPGYAPLRDRPLGLIGRDPNRPRPGEQA